MASIVLGTVGTVIGGPVGGAIGSAIGSAIDSMVVSALAPAQRIEGQRLETLQVTTSSEGAVLARV